MSYYVRFEVNCDEIELYYDLDDQDQSPDDKAWLELMSHFEKAYDVRLTVEFLQSVFGITEPDEVVECNKCGTDLLYGESYGKNGEILCITCYIEPDDIEPDEVVKCDKCGINLLYSESHGNGIDEDISCNFCYIIFSQAKFLGMY